MRSPTVQTKLVALLGNPLGHSISAAIHNRVYREMGLDYCYLPVEVREQDLATVFAGIKKMNFAGCNVTIPHKIAIIQLLDELDPLAAAIGAVNTVQLRDGKSRGFNTDGTGFLRSLKEEGNLSPEGKNFLLFGCGGASRAIAMTLAAEGAESITLCNRTQNKAMALADEINRTIRPCAHAIPAEEEMQRKHAEKSDVLINATSIGMSPQKEALPCPDQCILPHHIVADIVYNPHTTSFLEKAQKKGAKVVHGLGMLIYQGVDAFALFTGQEASADIMKEEAHRLLQE